MAETFTLEQVSTLLNTVVAGIRTSDEGDDRVYTLPEVKERTGFALEQLEADCIAGIVEHTHRGRKRGMTSRQIAILVRRHAAGGDLAKPKAEDALAQVRAASLKSGAKRAPRIASRAA